jgi:hypothetical protein
MHSRRALCLAAVALCLGTGARAQPAPASEAAVKAAFLYKFPAFVDWPAGVFRRPGEPLVIGVMGDDEVAADLEQIVAGRSVNGHPVVARLVADTSAAAGVHVLYVARRSEPRLRQAIEAVRGPVLVVTEQPGALAAGSVLNFVSDTGHMRFTASLTSAAARNLKLSARLLAVAQSVEGRAP